MRIQAVRAPFYSPPSSLPGPSPSRDGRFSEGLSGGRERCGSTYKDDKRPRAKRLRTRDSGSRERLPQILDQIIRVLEADGGAEEVLRGLRCRTLAGGSMLDQAFDTAEGGGPLEKLRAGRDGKGLFASAEDPERQHAAEVRHLSRRHIVPGMRFETGIVHDFYLFV